MMGQHYILIIIISSFVFTACSTYTDQMRSRNESFFLTKCQRADPLASHKDLRQCVDFVHNKTANQIESKNKVKIWEKVFNTVLGVGLIAAQVVTKTQISNPFNASNEYDLVGYERNYNPCNQFTADNGFDFDSPDDYIPIAQRRVQF